MSSTQPSKLRERLDESDAQVVVDIFSRCQLNVPTLKSLKSAVRRRQVVALRADGWKQSELARFFNVTERTIQNMLKRHRESEV
jgi:DNA-binding NarL/FixJ family response regulator